MLWETVFAHKDLRDLLECDMQENCEEGASR